MLPLHYSSLVLIVVLGFIVCYYDVRYRRIPNVCVLTGFFCGLLLHTVLLGWQGFLDSLFGCVAAFCLMLLVRFFSGATGPGDVKWFAATGAMIGCQLVLPAFLAVLMTGGVIAIITIFRLGNVRAACERIALILYGLTPGHQLPRYPVPANRKQAVPYGLAICLGSLITVARQLPQVS